MPRRRQSRKHWDPRRADPVFQGLAEQVIRESDNIPDFFYTGDAKEHAEMDAGMDLPGGKGSYTLYDVNGSVVEALA